MNDSIRHELALNPEDLSKFLVLRINAGDVEGLVALYEPNAVLACGNGQMAIVTEAIRHFYTEPLVTRPQFARGEQLPSLQNGDLALTSSRLENGNATAEVARQQPNGRWLWALDQPAINPKL